MEPARPLSLTSGSRRTAALGPSHLAPRPVCPLSPTSGYPQVPKPPLSKGPQASLVLMENGSATGTAGEARYPPWYLGLPCPVHSPSPPLPPLPSRPSPLPFVPSFFALPSICSSFPHPEGPPLPPHQGEIRDQLLLPGDLRSRSNLRMAGLPLPHQRAPHFTRGPNQTLSLFHQTPHLRGGVCPLHVHSGGWEGEERSVGCGWWAGASGHWLSCRHVSGAPTYTHAPNKVPNEAAALDFPCTSSPPEAGRATCFWGSPETWRLVQRWGSPDEAGRLLESGG